MTKRPILNIVERKFILMLGDFTLIFFALRLFVDRAVVDVNNFPNYWIYTYAMGFSSYFLLAYILDFFNLEKTSNNRYSFLSKPLFVSTIFTIIVVSFGLITFNLSYSRKFMLIFMITTPVQIFLWRIIFDSIFKFLYTTKNALYIYDNYSAESLRDDLSRIDGEDLKTFYKVKMIFNIESFSSQRETEVIERAKQMDSWIINTKSYNQFSDLFEKEILNSLLLGKEVLTYSSFYENTYEALPIKSHNDSFYEILQLKNKRIRYLQRITSFLINFILTFFVGLVFLLVTPFVIFFNFFFNRGSLFYTQHRVGQYGKEFKIYKFRSMVANAEAGGAKMATKNDSRITTFGKILRKFRVDELPQILSVIKGDMVFIGPRPERKLFVDQLNELLPYYNVRHLIKPGITGWAQVKYKYGENLEDSIQKLEYDLFYIKNQSVILDLKIILKTFTTILFSRGI